MLPYRAEGVQLILKWQEDVLGYLFGNKIILPALKSNSGKGDQRDALGRNITSEARGGLAWSWRCRNCKQMEATRLWKLQAKQAKHGPMKENGKKTLKTI